jgi:hypothetical protein
LAYPRANRQRDFGSGESERSEAPPDVEAETTPQESPRHEEDVPNTEEPSISRPRSPFEILGRGLRGCLMEAVQNLIPEDFLGGARVTSPEKIAQGIMISHYQVTYFYLGNFSLCFKSSPLIIKKFFFFFFFSARDKNDRALAEF